MIAIVVGKTNYTDKNEKIVNQVILGDGTKANMAIEFFEKINPGQCVAVTEQKIRLKDKSFFTLRNAIPIAVGL